MRLSPSIFIRLLRTPIDAKGDFLAARIAALNADPSPLPTGEEVFSLNPADFGQIPGSPFAYWVSDSIRRLFAALAPLESEERTVQVGLQTSADFRFVRAWWEVSPQSIAYSVPETTQGRGWAHFAKGGSYSPFHADVHLVVDWESDGSRLRSFEGAYVRNETSYFRPGLTWPRRPFRKVSFRVLPAGCVFSDSGPSAICAVEHAMPLLAILNSAIVHGLLSLSTGRGSEGSGQTQKVEVGAVQSLPMPLVENLRYDTELATLAREAHDLQRERDRSDETTHAFCLPGLAWRRPDTLAASALALQAAEQERAARLARIQSEIDEVAFDLYGMDEADRELVRREMGAEVRSTEDAEEHTEGAEKAEDDGEEEDTLPPEDLPTRVQDLLMWCVGVAFGRWDVRYALDPTLLPALQGPFDPLPRCAPGALVGADGLPPVSAAGIAPVAWLRARQNVLDLPATDVDQLATAGSADPQSSIVNPQSAHPQSPIAWDGILVDDPTHPADIVARVRQVLALLWPQPERAEAIEREACEILGFDSLRDYFRDPRKGFFPFHIKCYSKSRRKAPVYWLLQSARRNYAIWLYIHRTRADVLYAAGRDYADAKVALEQARLGELGQGLATLDGSARRRREREIERQERLVAEVTAFRNKVDQLALRDLPPDLNDGVVIGIAPLWELVPWKEAERTWERLLDGEYEWSTMAQRMRGHGLVKA